MTAVVEDCVNSVGVDLNTASVALLSHIAGLSKAIAQNVVNWRNEHGRFNDRKQLLEVTRLGTKAFEQCAGFLRIMAGNNPLDASTVHPEAYPIVEKILLTTKQPLKTIMGNTRVLNNLKPELFTTHEFRTNKKTLYF